MDAVKFLEEYERMKKEDLRSFSDFANLRKPDEIVAFVEKWSSENPKKTRAQDFFEKYPKAYFSLVGIQKNPALVPHGVCAYELGYFGYDERCLKLENKLKMEANDPICIRCWLKNIEG